MKSKRNKRSARKPLTATEINRSWDMVRKSVDETKNHNGVCNCDLSLALSSLINDAELIKKFPNPPKDEDLITPIFIPGWIDNLSEEQKAREREITVGADFMQEFGDFDIFGYWWRKPTLWQRLWLRFRIWRMRCKVRKVLQQR